MKKFAFKIILLVFIIPTLSIPSGCGASAELDPKVAAKNEKIIDSLYQLNNYRIEIDVVYPFNTLATTQVANDLLWNTGNNANRIDVRADGNFIQIRNDSLTGYLPFFGERRLNGGDLSGRNTAIQFEDTLSYLNKTINKKKKRLELNFKAEQANGGNDKYDLKIYIYPNRNALVDISPVYRTFIKYDGRLVNAEENEE